ncbi:SpoVK/Ycf46/Vps4 family AAA+-type ATPase [Variovorax sp. SG517]|uniref:hypothetical protein n=1 Tax=Variovorax sp. SG517 TaxID=2587117 RepID=UPI00159D12DF|nr:hypothetical protein [Variovorax sp. SG517]NVM87602.1 SpoVK/Ycf46/Vps4 family AAA+-type ATPase [Variovorax sp. SG517]
MTNTTSRAPYTRQAPPSFDKHTPKSVIVYGPPGCGKTRNAKKLLKGFGLNRVEDCWDGKHLETVGVLYLTNEVPARFSSSRRAFTLKEALAHVRRTAR